MNAELGKLINQTTKGYKFNGIQVETEAKLEKDVITFSGDYSIKVKESAREVLTATSLENAIRQFYGAIGNNMDIG
jgi:hypothetical protein